MELNEKIKEYILSKSVLRSERRIGIEVECFIYTKNFSRIPVNRSKEYSAIDLLNELNRINNDMNGTYSLEPGGQLEWSSPPCANMFELDDALASYKNLMDNILSKRNLISLHIGVEPFTDPDSIELIDQKKYQLMNMNMEKRGSLGKWMMRNTSSIQVNYDIIDQRDLEEVMFIADCIHPISAYLFAHSPFYLGKSVGRKNFRNHIWENTDNTRCRSLIDHGIYNTDNLLDLYISRMLEAPGIFRLDGNLDIKESRLTLRDELEKKWLRKTLTSNDIQAALHQIFTNVRLKTLIEIRDIDCLPFEYIIAPVAFLTGLIENRSFRRELLSEFSSWTKQERKTWNEFALQLDIDKGSLKNKNYIDWVKWVAEIAIDGLEQRKLGEEKYFIDYYQNIIDNGPLSIQMQNSYSLSKKALENFIFD